MILHLVDAQMGGKMRSFLFLLVVSKLLLIESSSVSILKFSVSFFLLFLLPLLNEFPLVSSSLKHVCGFTTQHLPNRILDNEGGERGGTYCNCNDLVTRDKHALNCRSPIK